MRPGEIGRGLRAEGGAVICCVAVAAGAAIGCLDGCGDAPGERPETELTEVADDASAARELELLQSLGYVSWTDEDADPSLLGVTEHDPASAFFGTNLFTDDVDRVFLMGMYGEILHTWHVPGGENCEVAEILPAGDLVVVCVDQFLARLDWDSKLLWSVERKVHHDVAVSGDSFVVPLHERHRQYRGRRVRFDGLLEVSARGEILDTWLIGDHLAEFQSLHGPSELDTEPGPGGEDPAVAATKWYDYYHLNTVEVLQDTDLGRRDPRFRPGNLLLCLRNANLVVILDRATRAVLWHWGPGVLDYPHMPTLLANGHLLVFDNGVHRDHSRVLEVDPVTEEIVWQYRSSGFHSLWRGSNQRLANGNTLICDSESGRVVEIDPEGRVVWQFFNPELQGGKRKRIYRMARYGPVELEALLGARFP